MSLAIKHSLVALNCCNQVSRDTICKLGTKAAVWADESVSIVDIGCELGISTKESTTIKRWLRSSSTLVTDQLRRAEDLGAQVITSDGAQYPAELLDLDLPPPVLYCRGSIPSAPAIAIVGSRKATRPNLEIAKMFGRELALRGLSIVSGFAIGIDQAAHRGALAAPIGTTVAVLGCGLDVDYPRRTRVLADEIEAQGAVVTEFPLGTHPVNLNFPIRNRLIAALSLGTLVVQATARSGSLITARLAVDLGRDVYGIPGSILDQGSVGPNTLIRDGALLVQHPRDIVDSLPLEIQARLETGLHEMIEEVPADPSSQLLGLIPSGRLVSIEELAAKTGWTSDRILCELLELEISAQVKRYPGPSYCKPL